jgi:AhpD family alkylhydroperoxidase
MSRVPMLTLETAPEAAKPFLENALKGSGFIPNLLAVLANAPAALETYITVSGLNAKSDLSLADREVVQLIAATNHGCDFCVAGHTAVARNKAKLPEDVIDALRQRGELPNERYETLAAFTREVIATRGELSPMWRAIPWRRHLYAGANARLSNTCCKARTSACASNCCRTC